MVFIINEVYCDLQVDLGIAVQRACENVTQPLKYLYPLDFSIKEKIEAIARSYGAKGVEYSEQVRLCVVVLDLHNSFNFLSLSSPSTLLILRSLKFIICSKYHYDSLLNRQHI